MNIFEKCLRNAPNPIIKLNDDDTYFDYLDKIKILVMQYSEWYENEVMPIMRRPDPSNGAPKPLNHNPFA